MLVRTIREDLVRTLLFSDLHSHNYREFSEYIDGVNSRLLDCVNAVEKIRNCANERKIIRIYFVGDLFHLKNNLSAEVIKHTMDALFGLASGREVILIPGNHDFTFWNRDPILLELISEYATTSEGKIEIITERGLCENIYFAPYTRQVNDLNDSLKYAKTSKEALFFGHQDIMGMQYGGFKVEKGLDPKLLSEKFKMSFIGHCHESMKVMNNVVSIGAPLQHNFSDSDGTRGWWIYDDETNEVEFIENDFSPRFYDYEYNSDAEEKGFIPGDFEKDFYRIKVKGHVELPERLKRLKWKRVIFETVSKEKKRTTISFSDKIDDLLEKYVKLKGGILDMDRLIEIGRKYL